MRHLRPQHLFTELKELDSGTGWCAITSSYAEVGDVDLLIAVAECDNYSSLNQFTRATESGVASTGEGKSGSTLTSFVRLIAWKRPRKQDHLGEQR